MFNKPVGYLTTTSDPQGRPTIFDCCPELRGHVLPVGRLDMDTEGLLILTNHGELAYRLTHPKYNIRKTYIATVKGVITPKALQTLSEGVKLRRVAIDQITLSHVDLGQVRPLTETELGRLFDRVQLSRSDYLNNRI